MLQYLVPAGDTPVPVLREFEARPVSWLADRYDLVTTDRAQAALHYIQAIGWLTLLVDEVGFIDHPTTAQEWRIDVEATTAELAVMYAAQQHALGVRW